MPLPRYVIWRYRQPLKIQGTSQWRWLLVLPAFLLGYFLPGFLISILWEISSSSTSGIDSLLIRVSEVLQTIVTGVCSVFFAGYLAPRRARVVRLVAATMNVIGPGSFLIYALLNDYYQSTPTLEVIWNIVLVVTQIVAAIATGLTRDLRQPTSPDSLSEPKVEPWDRF